MAKNSFVMYYDYEQHFELLTDEQLGQLLRIIYRYETTGELPSVNGALKMAFSFIKSNLDRNTEKYNRAVERNRQNGMQGGRPPKQTETEYNPKNPVGYFGTQPNPTEPKKADNVNDTDTVNDIDNGNEVKGASAPTYPPPPKHKYGEYGWVRLTESEYQRLIDDFGEDTATHYIKYVDESAEQTGNKNKWKNWNLTVRKAIKNQWGNNSQSSVPKPQKQSSGASYDLAELEEIISKGGIF